MNVDIFFKNTIIDLQPLCKNANIHKVVINILSRYINAFQPTIKKKFSKARDRDDLKDRALMVMLTVKKNSKFSNGNIHFFKSQIH